MPATLATQHTTLCLDTYSHIFCPIVPPLVIPVNRVVVGVEGMSAVLSFIVNNSFPLVTDDNVRWSLTRQGVTTDITNNTMVNNNLLDFQYNTTAQMYTLNISNIQPNYTSQFNLNVTNPAGVSTDVIEFFVEGEQCM